MKVFISWSRDLSHAVAVELHKWLPLVIQSLDPYISSHDISKGDRWLKALGTELQEQAVGILCVTQENVTAPWLLFEAGALSKSLESSYVMPLLIDLKSSDVPMPLGQFQGTEFGKGEIFKMIQDLNLITGGTVTDHVLKRSFDYFWPELEEVVNQQIREAERPQGDEGTPVRDDRELLEEILETVRGQGRMTDRSRNLVSPGALTELARSWDRFLETLFLIPDHSIELLEAAQRLEKPIVHILRRNGLTPAHSKSHLNRQNARIDRKIVFDVLDPKRTDSREDEAQHVDNGRSPDE